MLDVILLVELSWCFTWLTKKRLQSALLHTGGIIAAGYTALQATQWVSVWFTSPGNPAFLWLENNLTTETQAVAILSQFVPPQPVDTVQSQTHWISLHVFRALIFCALTFAVFITFSIIASLRTAIWDTNPDLTSFGSGKSWLTLPVALVATIYVLWLTLTFISNVAWIQPLHALAGQFGRSLAMHVYLHLQGLSYR